MRHESQHLLSTEGMDDMPLSEHDGKRVDLSANSDAKSLVIPVTEKTDPRNRSETHGQDTKRFDLCLRAAREGHI